MGKRAPSQLAAPAKRPAFDMFSDAAKQKRALAREKADCNRNKQYHAAGGLGFGWGRSTSSSAQQPNAGAIVATSPGAGVIAVGDDSDEGEEIGEKLSDGRGKFQQQWVKDHTWLVPRGGTLSSPHFLQCRVCLANPTMASANKGHKLPNLAKDGGQGLGRAHRDWVVWVKCK